MKEETTAEFLVRAGKKAVVRLGDIACRGQLPRLAPTSSAFMHERGDSLAFSICHRDHVFNFAEQNYILCEHYTVCKKSACIYVSLCSSLSISDLCTFPFNFFFDLRWMLSKYTLFLVTLFHVRRCSRCLFLIHRNNSEIVTETDMS